MAKRKKTVNIIFVGVILLMIIPQTRQPIQIFLQKGVARLVKPRLLSASETVRLDNFNWTLRDKRGQIFNLAEAKGKVLVINFWATWCPPCIAEMPSFQKLYDNYRDDEDLLFLFVTQEDSKVVEAFMKNKAYNLPYYIPMTDYPKEFDITSIPRTFIINKSGGIVLDKSGVANWDGENMTIILDKLSD